MAKKRPEMEEKILDVDASMQGTIVFKDPVNLRINGSFEGKLDTRGNLTIGENATVKADIIGDSIVIAGNVSGNITAMQGLSIIAPAEVNGSIETPLLSIAEGAIVNGKLAMQTARAQSLSDSDILSLRDVAQYLEVDTAVIEDWAAKKKIPGAWDGKEWHFQKAEIDHWIQEERVKV
ncbi:MAG: polymer-forming cytoskeletal protein [Candidatus Omnitrophica bacterium]|nr:polymer-forming cytoskeletal protein [Candidatus Omnitrophota bacterium]